MSLIIIFLIFILIILVFCSAVFIGRLLIIYKYLLTLQIYAVTEMPNFCMTIKNIITLYNYPNKPSSKIAKYKK